MSQPQPPRGRQSGPEARPAPKDALHLLKPGGPIKQPAQGFVNPGPTDNLRGVEPNTAFHKGEPNPEQKGSDIRHGDHNPGMGEAGNTHRPNVDTPVKLTGRHSDHSKMVPPPPPNPKGVRK